jgi:AAA15 family ATPase/GTPase
MILNFKVKNFRSIKDEIEISFEAANYKEHPRNVASIDGVGEVLKSTVIYGANASGKSNLIKAFYSLAYIVEEGAGFKPEENCFKNSFFSLDSNMQDGPVNFEIEFIAKDTIKYLYSITLNKVEIIEESLNFYPKGSRSLLFYREKNKAFKYGSYYKGAKKSIENKLLINQPFLSKAVLDNVKILENAYNYMSQFRISTMASNDYRFHISLISEIFANKSNDEYTNILSKMISAFDTGILNFKIIENDWVKKSLPEELPEDMKEKIKADNKYNIKTVHKFFKSNEGLGTTDFDIEKESEGTRALLVKGYSIIIALKLGLTLVIDELEKNLHPHIVRTLIKMFHDPRINKKNAQLIFATHDISQLDNEVFRRDQVWFTEKDDYGATSLFSLADFPDVRATTPFDKWYNNGIFGGTPLIDELTVLLSMDEEEDGKEEE